MNRLKLAQSVCVSAGLLLGALNAPPPANAQQRHAQPRRTAALREEFSFTLKDFKMEHQAETNSLNIHIRYIYKTGLAENEYPNFIPLAKDVEQFLTAYPNENTYWEIVNKELTKLVLDKYNALSSITCEIEVAPSRRHPYTRASRVTR
ncbi:MAG: hypothetical protein HYR56_28340 [Acidobacteria bacterium]|nr:hypothetical protein [Acidobacteriota bacterium]MBI3421437.1 hypothetical protein [Acidobacteriota bacterium]